MALNTNVYVGGKRTSYSATPWAFRCCVVQLRQNASILEQGYASFSPGSADRCHKLTWYPWRTSSPIRSRLGFRYTQEQVIRSERAPIKNRVDADNVHDAAPSGLLNLDPAA